MRANLSVTLIRPAHRVLLALYVPAMLLCAVLCAATMAPGNVRAATSGAGGPVAAVRALIGPQTLGSKSQGCYVSGTPLECPVTQRFLQAFQASNTNVNAICRCATQVTNARYKLTGNNGKTAWVHVSMRFGGGPLYTVAFVVRYLSSRWYVDNNYCAGRPSTSMYKNPVACF